LVNRFTYLRSGDGVLGTFAEEAAVLHGGDGGEKAARCLLSLDPFRPFDQQRSYLVPQAHSDADRLVLTLPTGPGHDIEVEGVVAPAEGGSQHGPSFVFTRHPVELVLGEGEEVRYDDTMSLRGTFKAKVRASTGGTESAADLDLELLGLVPGFAPSESLRPAGTGTEAAGDVFITFDLGPAIDRRTPEEQFGGGTESGVPANQLALSAMQGDAHGVTAWMTVHRGIAGTMRMIAEPPSGRNLKTASQGGVLEHAPLDLTVEKQDAPNVRAGFVPVLPPRGTRRAERASAGSFDIRRLAHERRKLAKPKGYGAAEAMPLTEADPVTDKSTTPLGFEIERLADGRIAAVTFAVSPCMIDGEPAEFQFAIRGGTPEGKGPLLLDVADALIRNRLFLVANRVPDPVADQGGSYLESRVAIGNWPFDVGLPNAKGRKPDQKLRDETLFIVKGYEGRSIVELANDPKAWSGRDHFLRQGNGAVTNPTANAQKHLADFIAQARTESENPNDKAAAAQYQTLFKLLNDASWAGVLIICCDLGLGDLPEQVQGLLGGMDLDKLRGEYVAIELKGIGSGSDARTKSRLSGLVDYRDPDKPMEKADANEPDHNGSYGFKVRRLLVGFANGEVATFDAKLDFYLGRLFHGFGNIWEKKGAAAWHKKDDSVLSLVGRYERVREGGATRETYTFETNPDQQFRYAAGKQGQSAPENGDPGAIIQTIDIRRVAYVTDASTPEGTDARAVVSRFLLNGSVKFGDLGGLDVIDIEALDFSEMGIATGFKIPRMPGIGGVERALRMFFNPGRLRFQFGSATKRPGRGFWSSFPLKFKALNLFDTGMSLPQLGYLGFGNFPATDGFRFGLEFDLDLGFLGSLAPKKGFKLSALFGFSDGVKGVDGNWAPRWALGIKFPDSDGKLDIGIQGVIKLRAERFKILDKDFVARGTTTKTKIKLLYAIGAQLEILGYKFPKDEAGISLFLFVDPKALGSGQASSGIGWFAARRPIDGKIGVFDLKAIALGQRIDPLPPNARPRTTKDVVNLFTELTSKAPYDSDTGNDETAALDKISTAIEKDYIRFDPSRGWSVGFSAVFADRVELGLAMRDDDIYGLRLGVTLSPGSKDYLFSLDILYRKLSEKLGVYSVEIVAPPSWRQLEFGVVSVTLPTIAFEIYTDGGFTIDLGYPFNKDYGRGFGVQVFPFIGSGGLYFRRVQGPAAWLIPEPGFRDQGTGPVRFDSTLLTYKPVTEVGVAFRVGLGKEINKGVFRAGLSVTVFAEIEGGYGVLWHDAGQPGLVKREWTEAASTFIAVRGQVGILGEIYGYVDFGIVKAGVSVRVWVAYGFDMKTDHRIRLYIEAGVSVTVSVVIARFKVFGHTIEISLHFSFSTTVDYSVYIGSDRNTQYYRFSVRPGAEPAALAETTAPVLTFKTAPAWTVDIPLADWRGTGEQEAWRMPVYLMPDVTLAAGSDGIVRPEAVFLGVIPDLDADGKTVGGSKFAVLLAAWAIANTTDRRADFALRDHEISHDTLDRIAVWVAAGDRITAGAAHASERRKRQPSFGLADTLLRANVRATISQAPQHGPADAKGVFFPLPPTATIDRSGFAGTAWSQTTRLADKGVVDDPYREKIDRELQRHMAVLERWGAAESLGAEAEPVPLPIAQVLFEDYIGLVIRGSLARLARLAADQLERMAPRADGSPNTLKLGELLDQLDSEEVSSGVMTMATRLFLHGARLPYPDAPPAGTIPPHILGDAKAAGAHHGLYRLGWLQQPLGAPADSLVSRAFVVDTGASFLQGAPLRFSIDGNQSDAYDRFAAKSSLFTNLDGRIAKGDTFRKVPRDFAAGRPRALDGGKAHLALYPADVVRHQAEMNGKGLNCSSGLRVYEVGKQTKPEDAARLDSRAVIVVSLRLQLVKPVVADATALDRFEIAGMVESDRVWLDALDLESTGSQRIERAAFYKVAPEGLSLLAAAQAAVVVQTDLSAEPKPFGAPEALAEASVAATYVASLDQLHSFVEIVRRTGITNRTGTSIGWPKAGDSIKQPDTLLSGDGTTPPIDMLMVLFLKDDVAKLANAVVFDVPSDDADARAYLDRHAFTFQIDSGNAAARADVTEPTAAPGVLPVVVTRPVAPPVPPGLDGELC
jgi:hypothetical protein